MKVKIAILFILAGVSCNCQKDTKNMEVFELTQGTVAMIDGVRIGCGGTFHGKFTVSDGTEKSGAKAILSIDEGDRKIDVGSGSVFTIKGQKYLVDNVKRRNLFRRKGIVYFHKE
jgi:hypothetical protein